MYCIGHSLRHTSIMGILSGTSKVCPRLFLGSGLNDLYEQYDDLQSVLTVVHMVSLQTKLSN